MPQPRKKVVKWTTEEAIRELFPGRVVEKAKQVAAESDAQTRVSTEKQ
jgi:hypothetical protein